MIAAFFLLLGFGGGAIVVDLSREKPPSIFERAPQCFEGSAHIVIDPDDLWADMLRAGVNEAHQRWPHKICAGTCNGRIIPIMWAQSGPTGRVALSQHTGGACSLAIYLNERKWRGLSDADKLYVVVHELGHAAGLSHAEMH
jgi:hypothetical protein